MAAPVGNKFWKARTKHGRDKLFADPKLLWLACCEYFQWIEDNPLKEERAFAYQGVITKDTVSKMRAMTIDGLCLFLDISAQTWYRWRGEVNDFSDTVSRVESVIRSQKFAGAAADMLNANIIARDLGLTDKQAQEHTGASGGPIKTESKIEWVIQPVKALNETNAED